VNASPEIMALEVQGVGTLSQSVNQESKRGIGGNGDRIKNAFGGILLMGVNTGVQPALQEWE